MRPLVLAFGEKANKNKIRSSSTKDRSLALILRTFFRNVAGLLDVLVGRFAIVFRFGGDVDRTTEVFVDVLQWHRDT